LARGVLVNINEAVGIIAAQSIGEPGTQLTMRTFHIGGTAQLGEQSYIEASQAGVVTIRNSNIIENQSGNFVVMGRDVRLVIVDSNKRERAVHKLSYGARIFVKDGDEVVQGVKLAEWDPYTIPIIAEKGGITRFVDLVSNVSIREEIDDATGISQRIVSDWRQVSKGAVDLRPGITISDGNGEPIRLSNGSLAHYFLSVSAILSVEDGQKISAGDVLARIPREGARTRDITGGLPRVAELFEARRPKDHAVIAEIDGYVQFGKDFKNKRRVILVPLDEEQESKEYLFPKGKHVPVQEGDFVQKGDYIVDGKPAPHDILAVMGVEALADYLINEVQDVYRLQGVQISDKHIEVIVRQMLQKVEVTDSGDTTFLVGEQVDNLEIETTNQRMRREGRREATVNPVLLGITKASLQTHSFISAASFQETTRILTEASIQGKSDRLRGLKENVIVGRLIPAGTGGVYAALKKIALERDQLLFEQADSGNDMVSSEDLNDGKNCDTETSALPESGVDGGENITQEIVSFL
jgi:DNA-directed RNA polymerase subunit beta'